MEPDPINDDEQPTISEPSQDSVKSFWMGISGLCIALQLVELLSRWLLHQLLSWPTLGMKPITSVLRLRWRLFEAGLHMFSDCFAPCIAMASIVPILFWRGGLAQRFAISVAIAITTMNFTHDRGIGNATPSISELLPRLLFQVVIWGAFPALFLYTPVRTLRLRTLAALCLLILAISSSLRSLAFVPSTLTIWNWMIAYGTVLAFSLIRRNWGKAAFIEKGMSSADIERTSSRTMLELMAISGLACSAFLSWPVEGDLQILFWIVQAIVLGLTMVLMSMGAITMGLQRKRARFAFMCFAWMFQFFILVALYVVVSPRRFINVSRSLQDPTFPYILLLAGGLSLICSMYVSWIAWWLRRCGWHMLIAETTLEVDEQKEQLSVGL